MFNCVIYNNDKYRKNTNKVLVLLVELVLEYQLLILRTSVLFIYSTFPCFFDPNLKRDQKNLAGGYSQLVGRFVLAGQGKLGLAKIIDFLHGQHYIEKTQGNFFTNFSCGTSEGDSCAARNFHKETSQGSLSKQCKYTVGRL